MRNLLLLWAITHDSLGAARLALRLGADPNATRPAHVEGWIFAHGVGPTAGLLVAVQRRNEPMVKLLVEAGADANVRSDEAGSALYVAAELHDLALAKLLVEHGADVRSKEGVLKGSALHAAVRQGGGLELASQLLAWGADPNASDEGETPLHAAAYWGDVEAMKLLLAKGARLDSNDRGEHAIIFSVCTIASPAALEFLLARGAPAVARDAIGNTPLMIAAIDQKGAKARPFLSALSRAGNAPDAKRDSGETALMLAAAVGNLEAVSVLLELGASPGLKDKEGKSALDHAREGGYDAVAALLTRR